tara:strand:+ start:607 stop:843 length:237 start_codon:yes stop_codon:yes gene_type:complete
MKQTSKYKGISFNESINKISKPWRAEINTSGGGGLKFLGTYETEEQAVRAWNEVAEGHNMETHFYTEVFYIKEGEDYV